AEPPLELVAEGRRGCVHSRIFAACRPRSRVLAAQVATSATPAPAAGACGRGSGARTRPALVAPRPSKRGCSVDGVPGAAADAARRRPQGILIVKTTLAFDSFASSHVPVISPYAPWYLPVPPRIAARKVFEAGKKRNASCSWLAPKSVSPEHVNCLPAPSVSKQTAVPFPTTAPDALWWTSLKSSKSPALGPPLRSASTFVTAVRFIVVLIVVVVPAAFGAASANVVVAITATAAAAAAAKMVVRIVSFPFPRSRCQ